MLYNIMMDFRKMWPEPYHTMAPYMNKTFTARVKSPFTRTARSPKYYIIDFGLSRRYSPDDLRPTETAPEGGDRTVPEFQNEFAPHDPFAVDFYCVGNVIQKCILNVSSWIIHYLWARLADLLLYEYAGCDFLKPFVNTMRDSDPRKRPTTGQVVERYNRILKLRWWWQLRNRIILKDDEGFEERIVNRSRWLLNTISHILKFKCALPKPNL